MTGAILEIEELCGALTAAQMNTLRMWPDRKVDLALDLCRMADGVGHARGFTTGTAVGHAVCQAELLGGSGKLEVI